MQYYYQNKEIFDEANVTGNSFSLHSALNPLIKFKKMDIKYFINILNYCNQLGNQLVGFLQKNENNTKLAIANLICANQSLEKMQSFFEKCTFTYNLFIEEYKKICVEKANIINQMIHFYCVLYK